MALRDEASDAGRKGAPSVTKQVIGHVLVGDPAKGRWLPAYSGRNDWMGYRAEEVDEDIGSAEAEVGNRDD